MGLVAPFRRELRARCLGPLVLDHTERQVAESPDQPCDGECATSQHRGRNHQAEQWQREQGIDHGDVVPGHPVV